MNEPELKEPDDGLDGVIFLWAMFYIVAGVLTIHIIWKVAGNGA